MVDGHFDQPFHHARFGGGPADHEDSSEQHPVFLVQLLVLHSEAEWNIHERIILHDKIAKRTTTMQYWSL